MIKGFSIRITSLKSLSSSSRDVFDFKYVFFYRHVFFEKKESFYTFFSIKTSFQFSYIFNLEFN